jgi:hypothetical protein
MKKLKQDLQAVTKEFNALTKKTKELTDKLKKTAAGQIEKARAAVKPEAAARRTAEALKIFTKTTEKIIRAVEKFEKDQAAKKTRAKAETTRKAPPQKNRPQTATEQVVNIIKRSRKGVDVPTLVNKTGFEEKKIRNILFRASRQGKIERAGRGIYVATK